MALVFFVGMEIGSEEGIFQKIRKSLLAIGIQSTLVISGSLLFGGLSSFLIRQSGFSAVETMGASAGLGWYSLSAVMISEMHSAVLGTVAFIVNLSRELLAILFIPVFSRFFPLAAVSAGGAASMDVLLGLISRHNRLGVTLIAFGQGVVCSMMVPILITLIFK
jgi:uncharacterized membrane protein YbjE (DUF340 family)